MAEHNTDLSDIGRRISEALAPVAEAFAGWVDLFRRAWLIVDVDRAWYGCPAMRAQQVERRRVAKDGRRSANGRAWAAFEGRR